MRKILFIVFYITALNVFAVNYVFQVQNGHPYVDDGNPIYQQTQNFTADFNSVKNKTIELAKKIIGNQYKQLYEADWIYNGVILKMDADSIHDYEQLNNNRNNLTYPFQMYGLTFNTADDINAFYQAGFLHIMQLKQVCYTAQQACDNMTESELIQLIIGN